MKMRLMLTIVGLASSFALPTFAQKTSTPDPQLRQQVDVFVKQFDPAFNNNDPTALAPFYTEDAVLVVPEGPVYGREAIVKFSGRPVPQSTFQRPSRHARSVFPSYNRNLWQ